MIEQIKMLEPEWRPPEIKVLYDQLQAEIAKAFALPVWALDSEIAQRRFLQQAYEATEQLQLEATRLFMEHCFSRVLISTESLEKSTLGPQATLALCRPSNYHELSAQEQWDVDRNLGILDWDGRSET